jgi:hypothetical protein
VALTDDDMTGAPGMQPVDPYVWPPPEWLQQQPVTAPDISGVPPAPPIPPPPMPEPTNGNRRKHMIGETGPLATDEVPAGAIAPPLPDVNPMSDNDPRLDMTPEELAAKKAPPNLGEFETDFVGKPAPLPSFDIAKAGQQASADYGKITESQQDEVQVRQAQDAMGAVTPGDKELVRQGYFGVKQQDKQRADMAKLVQDDLQRQQDAYASFQKAQVQAQQDLAEIDQQAKQIGQLNPNHYAATTGTGQKILGVLAAITGGMAASSPYGNGKNVGLDMLNQAIERDTEAQKYNINARIQQLGMARNSVTERMNLATEAYKSEEIHRQALFQSAVNKLQTDQQNYDPRGSQYARIGGYIQQIQAQRQASAIEAGTKLAKMRLDAANAGKAEAETAQIYSKMAGIGQGAAGGATNPHYTVATGLFDPFTKQPIFAKTKLKDEKGLQEELKTYRDEQRAWQQLRAIAKKMDGHKSASGQISERFKSTDEKEYERARAALLTVKIRALGERPTEQAIKNQESLVPDLQKALGQADTVKMLEDAQQENDAQFAGHLNILGVDGDTVIGNAQRHRADAPEPKVEDEVTSANEAVQRAQTPAEKRDALRAVHDAQDRAAVDLQRKEQENAALETAKTLTPVPLLGSPVKGAPADEAVFKSLDDARDTYNQRLAKYHAALTAKKPSQDDIKAAAVDVVKAKQALEAIEADAHQQLNQWGRPHGAIDTSFPHQ